jgi:hypothetical protein
MKIWALEFAVHGRAGPGGGADPQRMSPADPEALHCVRGMKREVRELVARRQKLGGAVPSDAAQWSLAWERPTWDTLAGASPWDRLVIGHPTIDAEASPV